MSENIEVKVQDSVSPAISGKIKEIANSARSANDAVLKLQAALSSINTNALSAITQQSSTASAAINSAALASQRLATEQQRTAQAISNAAAAQSRAESAAIRLAQAQEKAAASGSRMQVEAEQLKQSLNPLYAAQQAHNKETQKALELYKAGAINVKTYTDAVNRSTEKMDAAKTAHAAMEQGLIKVGKGAQLSKHHLTNLGFQLQDIGVSLAGGQNPLLVLAQQGSQIAGISAQAGIGMGGMAKAAAMMLVPFLPLVAAIGVAYGALKLFQSEVSKDADLKKYSESLGLTAKEMKKLEDVSVTFGDTMKGLWQTISDETGAGDALKSIMDGAKDAFKGLLSYIALAMQSVVALMQAAYETGKEVFLRLPGPVKTGVAEAINSVIGMFEGMANVSISAVNRIIAAMNKISTTEIKPLDKVTFSRVPTEFAAANGKSLSQTFVDSYVSNLEKNKASTTKFIADWQKNTANTARSRIKKQADEIIKDRNPVKDKKGRADHTEENRELALKNVNTQLEHELVRMKMVGDELERQQKLDQISEQLARKKIDIFGKGNEAELKSIQEKIAAIQDASRVSKKMNDIYNEAVGPQREYTSSINAAVELQKQGKITQEQYNAAITKAADAYVKATDPLSEFNKEIEQQLYLSKFGQREMEIERQIMQARNLKRKEGQELLSGEESSMRENLKTLRDRNEAMQVESGLLSESVDKRRQFALQLEAINKLSSDQNSGFTAGDKANAVGGMLGSMGLDTSNFQTTLDAQVSMFATYQEQLAAMRNAQLISEQEYASASLQIEMKRQSTQIASAQGFFGNLASLQNSSSKKMAAVGKAAAIAQAMISTYQSATSAYASMAAIPYVGPALGAAAAAAAIAAGLANVQQIRSQNVAGYMTGGYTGDGPIGQVAGVVHGKEFVMNAAATDRIGVDNLHALQSGAASIQGGPSSAASVGNGYNAGGNAAPTVNVTTPVNAVVVSSMDQAISAMRTTEGKKVIIEILEENSNTVARIAGAR